MGNVYSENLICTCDGEKLNSRKLRDNSRSSSENLMSSVASAERDTRDKYKCNIQETEISLSSLSLAETKEIEINGGSEDSLDLPMNVLYYGWFFSVDVSTQIESVVLSLYQLCFAEVSQFQRFILTCCKDADVRDPFEYYKKPGKKTKTDADKMYHMTAKFLARKQHVPYQHLVQSFCDKSFRIHLIGLVFTPRTLGIRARLTRGQQLIFDEKDTPENSSQLIDYNSSDVYNQIEKEIKKGLAPHRRSNPKCKFKEKEGDECVTFKKYSRPNLEPEFKSRAHITVGCAPNVIPKQTGDDLVDIVDLENRASTRNGNFQQDFKLKYGTLRQFGRQGHAFVLYPEMEMIVPGSFRPFI